MLLFTRWLFRDLQSISPHVAGGSESTPFAYVISTPSPLPLFLHILNSLSQTMSLSNRTCHFHSFCFLPCPTGVGWGSQQAARWVLGCCTRQTLHSKSYRKPMPRLCTILFSDSDVKLAPSIQYLQYSTISVDICMALYIQAPELYRVTIIKIILLMDIEVKRKYRKTFSVLI